MFMEASQFYLSLHYWHDMLLMQAYAAPQLNADRGFDDAVYGFGSGVFFVGYMVCFAHCKLPQILSGCTIIMCLALLMRRQHQLLSREFTKEALTLHSLLWLLI